MAHLIVLSGLPGTGKTSLARILAERLSAVLVRIDSIEQALRNGAGADDRDIGPAGYYIGYAVARDNLRLGRIVVADSVNPVPESRDAWRSSATASSADCTEIEVVCSSSKEHRRRVESRESDIPGHVLPDWDAVLTRDYQPWDRDVLTVDTVRRSPEDLATELVSKLRLTVR